MNGLDIYFGQKVSQCEAIIGYEFVSKRLCAEALNTAADGNALYTVDGTQHRMPKNTRLAIVGDIVSALHLCRPWYRSGLPPGEWSTIKGVLDNENLDPVGRNHGLHECINFNGGTVVASIKTVATTVEAIMGAAYEDGGDAALGAVMDRLGLQ